VGKTEMTEALAKVLYKDKWQQHYQRVDCGTLSGEGDETKLIGTSPKWIGYGDPVLIQPKFLEQEGGTIVVFDEAEKAHPEVWKAFLSITDKAVLPVFLPTDNAKAANHNNKEVASTNLQFDNTIVIFTSNAGSQAMQQERAGIHSIGFIQ